MQKLTPNYPSICMFLFFFALRFSSAFSLHMSDIPYALYTTLNYYFHGENLGELPKIISAYHDYATFTYVDSEKEEVISFPVQTYLKNYRAHPHTYTNRELDLIALDITGNIAVVNTRIIYKNQGKRLNEYLSLLLIDGKWKIIHRLSFKEFASFDHFIYSRNDKMDKEKIRQVLYDYIEGRDHKSKSLLHQAFHPHSEIFHLNSSRNDLKFLTREDFITYNHDCELLNSKTWEKIEFIHSVGNIAIAKVSIRFKKLHATLTDYISLAKINDEWQIVKKISQQDKKFKSMLM